jgi:hypothetical protein
MIQSSRAPTRTLGNAPERPDLTEIVATGLRQNLMKQKIEAHEVTSEVVHDAVPEAKADPSQASKDAPRLANELLVSIQKRGKITPIDLEQVLVLLRQMNETDFEASFNRLQELISSPHVDASSL